MTTSIFSPAFAEQTTVPTGQFYNSLLAYQQDLQTGLVEVDFSGQGLVDLLFARGKLVNIYRIGSQTERLEVSTWVGGIRLNSPVARVRSLALTPQAVRILKILIEQPDEHCSLASLGCGLESSFAAWREHPVPALVHVRWPSADALVLLPGLGALPRYSLFVAADQVLRSAGNLMAIYGWKETPSFARLLSSGSPTQAWTEYLLHHSFSRMIGCLLTKFEELAGRSLLNQVIRDINFISTAHDWAVSLNAASLTDQTIFPSASAAAEIYSRLLDAIFLHFEAVLGVPVLDALARESLLQLSPSYRALLIDYRLFLPPRAIGIA